MHAIVDPMLDLEHLAPQRLKIWTRNEYDRLALGRTHRVRAHSPYAASDDSEPEPDISVSRPEQQGHPTSSVLVIEVSDSSLRIDRTIKAGIYARSGVPEYWIVDVHARAIEIRTGPQGDTFTHLERVTTGLLRPTLLPSVVLDVLAVPWPSR